MRTSILMILNLVLLPFTATMADSLYCPGHSRYIDIGMSEQQVLGACGQPLSKQTSNMPIMEKVPVTQMIYTTINSGSVYPGLNSAFYDQWSLPSGTTGMTMQVDIMNNKVSSIKINGASNNAMTICHDMNVKVGDEPSQVYNACGSPTMVNTTYVNQPIRSNKPPEVWVYQFDRYQAPISLTFVDGTLQSIH